jgi:hypothetical protein
MSEFVLDLEKMMKCDVICNMKKIRRKEGRKVKCK